ncbi:MAG: hypothetical protein JNJ78_06345 [Anaerolineae bacterium]|nr:hypothetical protein [Anaerolineae bacterium]
MNLLPIYYGTGAIERVLRLAEWLGGLADDPPLLAAGTGESGARWWRLSAGTSLIGALGCGKYGVGCRHAAKPAGVRGTAAGKKWPCAGRRGTAADKRRHRRQSCQSIW